MHWGRHHHLQAHFGSPLQGAEHNFMWISIRGGHVVYFHMRICGVFVVVFVIVFVFVFAFSSDFWIAIVISFQNMYGIGVCEASEQCYWSSLKWWRTYTHTYIHHFHSYTGPIRYDGPSENGSSYKYQPSRPEDCFLHLKQDQLQLSGGKKRALVSATTSTTMIHGALVWQLMVWAPFCPQRLSLHILICWIFLAVLHQFRMTIVLNLPVQTSSKQVSWAIGQPFTFFLTISEMKIWGSQTYQAALNSFKC